MKKFEYLSHDRRWLDVPKRYLFDNGMQIYDYFSKDHQIREKHLTTKDNEKRSK